MTMPKQDTETKKGVSGVQELREAIKDGLANHTGEFLNPWLIKTTSNYSHEQLAQILDSILDSERLYKNLQSVIDKSVNEAKREILEHLYSPEALTPNSEVGYGDWVFHEITDQLYHLNKKGGDNAS